MNVSYRIVDSDGDPCDLSSFTPLNDIPVTMESVFFDKEGNMQITLRYLHETESKGYFRR